MPSSSSSCFVGDSEEVLTISGVWKAEAGGGEKNVTNSPLTDSVNASTADFSGRRDLGGTNGTPGNW